MAQVLETELKTYEQNRERLLGECEGKYVLIHNDQILGAYDSKMDAINTGYQRLGNVPFLVKQVVRVEVPEYITSSLLGV
jgi:hypothetical protein